MFAADVDNAVAAYAAYKHNADAVSACADAEGDFSP